MLSAALNSESAMGRLQAGAGREASAWARARSPCATCCHTLLSRMSVKKPVRTVEQKCNDNVKNSGTLRQYINSTDVRPLRFEIQGSRAAILPATAQNIHVSRKSDKVRENLNVAVGDSSKYNDMTPFCTNCETGARPALNPLDARRARPQAARIQHLFTHSALKQNPPP